ncbi:DUF1800 family protein [Akkermansiaceae bacterium]|nr:DUF1800 family protein [Akkermansiaceae bacterium]
MRDALRFGMCVCPGLAVAIVDLDGNQASEFWESQYPGISVDNTDSDNDGFSNYEEMVAGTDPVDPQSFLRLAPPVVDESEFELRWNGVAGKVYTVESWNGEASSWESLVLLSASVFDGERFIELPRSGSSGLYRITVSDTDADQDGVSAWEEALLGWDDGDIHGSGSLDIPDFEMAVSRLEQPEGVTLANGQTLLQRLPSEEEAARFLVQSTFGPSPESIQEVTEKGICGWLSEQLALPATKTRSEMFKTGQAISAVYWRHGWWRTVLIADDQLRQRLAYALSQIFVVNNEPGSVIGDNALVHASYYDPLITEAFGTYREILEHVTYSPSMGFYLSHLNNRKSDPAANRFPDENFAREIMQLFSIGLWKLDLDGTHLKDIEGKSIPTYDNEVITELAKVFTGMSHSTTNRGQQATSFYDSATGDDYKFPLKVWDEEHEQGVKMLFDGVMIPDGQTGEEDVQQALDALAAHDSLAPFFSRLLIQRMTSSNPSPDYLRRVSTAWSASSGNLGKVVKAILLDPESRTVDRREGLRGKVREPLIRMTHIMRAFALPDESGTYGILLSSVKNSLNQMVMSSPSVFNFYLPDYSPQGELSDMGVVAPELQIATTSALLSTHDLLKQTASTGHWVRGVDHADELALVGDGEALVDHLDLLLTYGTMGEATRAVVLERIAGESNEGTRVQVAIQMVVISPEFSVLK